MTIDPWTEPQPADARAIAALLEDEYDFEVELIRNADRKEIVSALNAYRKRLDADDNLQITNVTVSADTNVMTGIRILATSLTAVARLQSVRGELAVNGVEARAGDGLAASDERSLSVTSREAAEALVFDLA